MSSISNIVAGWPFDNVVSFPTLPDIIGTKNLTATNMEAGDIVDDFPVGVVTGGIISPIIDRVITPVVDRII